METQNNLAAARITKNNYIFLATALILQYSLYLNVLLGNLLPKDETAFIIGMAFFIPSMYLFFGSFLFYQFHTFWNFRSLPEFNKIIFLCYWVQLIWFYFNGPIPF